MAKIIAVANQKGGVGKTTTTYNLGVALRNAGKSVLLVDLDPQGDLSEYIGYTPDNEQQLTIGAVLHNASQNQAVPLAIADIGVNVRIAVLKNPLVDEDVFISSSIRKVSGSVISREMLLQNTLTEDMVIFLETCLRYGVSICSSGSTGSGKTTLTGFLLKQAATDLRAFTIEEGSREWDVRQYDENGKVSNSVVHMKTRNHEEKSQNIDQNRGVEVALRFNPDLIGVGEMRSGEAFAATEASNTGHTVLTTVHANSAYDAVKRIVTLCKKAYEFTDATLTDMVTAAFPIQVFQELMFDGKRRVTQIVEVEGYQNGDVIYNPIFEFHVEDNYIEDDGTKKVIGDFRQVNPISEPLYQHMLRKGASRKILETFFNFKNRERKN